MRVNVKDLAKEGARVRLKEVEAALKPLLEEQRQLQTLLDNPRKAIQPSRANGKWRMTKKRRETLEKMWEGRRRRWAEDKARAASTSTPSDPSSAEPNLEEIMERPLPPEPYLPWTEEDFQAIAATKKDCRYHQDSVGWDACSDDFPGGICATGARKALERSDEHEG